MSFDYQLIGQFPFDSPQVKSVLRAAEILGETPDLSLDHRPRFTSRALLVYGDPADEDEQETARTAFGFANNATLVLVDLSSSDIEAEIRVNQDMLRIMADLARTPGFRGVLVTENSWVPLASVSEGRIQLSSEYRNWPLAQTIIAGVPELAEILD